MISNQPQERERSISSPVESQSPALTVLTQASDRMRLEASETWVRNTGSNSGSSNDASLSGQTNVNPLTGSRPEESDSSDSSDDCDGTHHHQSEAAEAATFAAANAALLSVVSQVNDGRIAQSIGSYVDQGLTLLRDNMLEFSDPFASFSTSFLQPRAEIAIQTSLDNPVAPGSTDNGAFVSTPQFAAMATMGAAMTMPLGESLAFSQAPTNRTDRVHQTPVTDSIAQPADRQRPIEARDNPQDVERRYSQHLERLFQAGTLTREQVTHMQETFHQSMEAMTTGPNHYTAEHMQEICRSMNTVLDNNAHRLTDMQSANALIDMAAQGRDSIIDHGDTNHENAFGQGGHNSCAGTSHNRLLAQRNFVEYSNRIASLTQHGGAYVGGHNGQPRQWVAINTANFRGDAESNRPWNASNMLQGGQRGMATLLGNALEGQAQADLATIRDRQLVNPDLGRTLTANERYEYVTCNAVALGASAGQSQTGEGLFLTNTQTGTREFRCGNPPASLDIVGARNNADGLGGIFVHESYRAGLGNLPGINYFSSADNLRGQLSALRDPQRPGLEYQIATNGTMVANRPGHGLHAQTVRYQANTNGQGGHLSFGNNWTHGYNNVQYSDEFVNQFTNFGTARHSLPDGHGGTVPDWRHEHLSPDGNRNNPNTIAQHDEHDRHEQRDYERPQNTRVQLDRLNQMLADLSQWYSNLNAATARGQAARQEFLASKARPELSRYQST